MNSKKVDYYFDGLILDVPFDVHDFSLGYKDEMENTYNQNIQSTKGYSVEYSNEEYANYAIDKFLTVVNKIFYVDPPQKKIVPWVYVQNGINKQNHDDMWHNHIDTSTINAVYYIDIAVPRRR